MFTPLAQAGIPVFIEDGVEFIVLAHAQLSQLKCVYKPGSAPENLHAKDVWRLL